MQKQDKTLSHKTGQAMSNTALISRRKLLQWTPPVVAAVALPTHAQASTMCTEASPFVDVTFGPKCSGDPIVSDITVLITSDSATVDVQITDIMVSGNTADDTLTLPTLPATVTMNDGVEITWQGPGTDAQTCLPTNNIDITVFYTCLEQSIISELTFNLTEEAAKNL